MATNSIYDLQIDTTSSGLSNIMSGVIKFTSFSNSNMVLTTTNVIEGTNLYYTDARVNANTEVAKGVTAFGWGNHGTAGYLLATSYNDYTTAGLATTSYVNTQDNLKLNLTGGTLTGTVTTNSPITTSSMIASTTTTKSSIDLTGGNIYANASTNSVSIDIINRNFINSSGVIVGSYNGAVMQSFVTPVNDTDVANKAYVDSMASGLKWKTAVVAATTSNITLSGLQTIDGVALSAGDRVLVKNQTNQTENGIYEASATGWTRSADSDTGAEILNSAMLVSGGTTNAGSQWTCSNTGTITIGTTNITYTQISGGSAAYYAGTGLTLSGNTFNITTNGVTNNLIRQSAAVSVIGNSTNATANVADISAGADNQLLLRRSNSLVFGTLVASDIPALDMSKITTGNLSVSRLTGYNDYTTASLVYTVNTVAPSLGNVTLTTDNVAEGTTNKYYSDSLVNANTNVINAITAFGWGNHATAGYIKNSNYYTSQATLTLTSSGSAQSYSSLLSPTSVGTNTINGNTLSVGDIISIKMGGYMNVNTTGTFSLKVMFGSVTLSTNTDYVISSPKSNNYISLEFEFIVRSIGTSGTVIGNGALWSSMGGTGSISSPTLTELDMTSTAIVNTTISNAVDVQISWLSGFQGDINITTAYIKKIQ
jgi:hypothetical protein